MSLQTTRRLPGTRFATDAPTPRFVMPRMDITGFVGFAASGPLHTPVPIESVERFRDVFGPDLPLAWDEDSGRVASAHLAPAVEAFFRNGGKRCWVVRVADADTGTANTFPVAGLVHVNTGQPAMAQARSIGGWSDDLSLSAVLNRQVLGRGVLGGNAGNANTVAIAPTAIEVGRGDLLRLRFDQGLVMLATVSGTGTAIRQADGNGDDLPTSASRVSITIEHGPWFQERTDESLPELSLPDLDQPTPTSIEWMRMGGEEPVPLPDGTVIAADDDGFEVTFDAASDSQPDAEPTRGDVLHLTVHPLDGAGDRMLWLTVADVRTQLDSISPPATVVTVTAEEGLWRVDDDEPSVESILDDADGTTGASCDVIRLSFDLIVWRDQEIYRRIGDLGFSGVLDEVAGQDRHTALSTVKRRDEHDDDPTRYWARLQIDENAFRLVDGHVVRPPAGTLEADTYEPRFPIAGPVTPPLSPPQPPLYAPLGMPTQPAAADALGALNMDDAALSSLSSAERLEREGLHQFGAALFLDDKLAGDSVSNLPVSVRDRLYSRSTPVPLKGLHSLYTISEVTLLAITDGAHRGWSQSPSDIPFVLGAPEDLRLVPLEAEVYVATWSAVTPPPDAIAVTYELVEAVDPEFIGPRTRYTGSETTTHLRIDAASCLRRYYRVRARLDQRIGPWSLTRSIVVPPPDYVSCARPPLIPPALELRIEDAAAAAHELVWAAVPGATAYTVETGPDPAMAMATAVVLSDEGPDDTFGDTIDSALDVEFDTAAGRLLGYQVPGTVSGTLYARVRALRDDELGPWSVTVVMVVSPDVGWSVIDETTYNETDRAAELLAVQRAAMRFCAARGDVMVVLSMPRHYREDTVLDHVGALVSTSGDDDDEHEDQNSGTDGSVSRSVRPLRGDELRALSYAAVYHPWLGIRLEQNDSSLVTMQPPDGTAAGMIAARSLREGAWWAPANVALRGVLALAPNIDGTGWERLHNAQVNLVRPEPRAFLLLSADTLSQDEDLRPIGVRRLLILLRRLVLREGGNLVFESNSAALRRRIFFQFRDILGDLYERGAFSGATPDAAFRVTTDERVNPPESVDRGQLVVELAVAPSRPLSFLTVRLVQREAATPVVEEL